MGEEKDARDDAEGSEKVGGVLRGLNVGHDVLPMFVVDNMALRTVVDNCAILNDTISI
jgi:hypothetical protein